MNYLIKTGVIFLLVHYNYSRSSRLVILNIIAVVVIISDNLLDMPILAIYLCSWKLETLVPKVHYLEDQKLQTLQL